MKLIGASPFSWSTRCCCCGVSGLLVASTGSSWMPSRIEPLEAVSVTLPSVCTAGSVEPCAWTSTRSPVISVRLMVPCACAERPPVPLLRMLESMRIALAPPMSALAASRSMRLPLISELPALTTLMPSGATSLTLPPVLMIWSTLRLASALLTMAVTSMSPPAWMFTGSWPPSTMMPVASPAALIVRSSLKMAAVPLLITEPAVE